MNDCMGKEVLHTGQNEKYEYIKCYWKCMDDEAPVLLFYEIDLENERYATRMTEVFSDRRAVPVVEEGFPFITEAPVPPAEEINREFENDPEDKFFAVVISREEFEEVYQSSTCPGDIRFPE